MADARMKLLLELNATGEAARQVKALAAEVKVLKTVAHAAGGELKGMAAADSRLKGLFDPLRGSALSAITGEFGRLGTAASLAHSRIASIGPMLSSLGSRMTLLTAPLAVFGAMGIRTAAAFEHTMKKVAHLTGYENTPALGAMARNLGQTSLFMPEEAAGAMAKLGASGFRTPDILTLIPDTLKFATAGELGLAEATDFATSAMNAFQLKAVAMRRLMDDVVYVTDATNSEVHGLGESFKYAASSAAAAKIPYREVLALLGVLSNAGIKDSTAGTSLAMAFSRLMKEPTDAMKRTFKHLGITKNMLLDAKGELHSFLKVLDLLHQRKAQPGVVLQLFEEEAGKSVLALLNQGPDKVRTLLAEITNQVGALDEKSRVMGEGATAAMKRFQGAVQNLQIALGESGLLRGFTAVVEKMGAVVQKIGAVNPELLAFVGTVGAVTLATGPLVFALAQVAHVVSGLAKAWLGLKALLILSSPELLAIGAMTSLAAYGGWWLTENFQAMELSAGRAMGKVPKWDDPGFARQSWHLGSTPLRDELKEIARPLTPKGVSAEYFLRGNEVPLEAEYKFKPRIFQTLRDVFGLGIGADGPQDKVDQKSDLTPLNRDGEKPAQPSAFLSKDREVRVVVDFKNLPRGARIATDNPGRVPFAFNLGYAMENG